MKEHPYLTALFCDAEEVRPKWRFDEQQADPIHAHWDWNKAKEELRRLLQQTELPDGLECGCDAYFQLFGVHRPGCKTNY